MNAVQEMSEVSAPAAGRRLASLRRFLEVEPGNVRLRRDVLNTAVAAGEFGYVRELAERRLADVPGDPEAHFDRATALIGLREYGAALEALRPLDATIPGVRFNTGLCLFMLERYADARPYFEAGYEAGERDPSLLRTLLLTLHQQGEYEAAIKLVADNEAAFAAVADLAGQAALLYSDALQPEAAARWAARSLALDPGSVPALVVDGTLRAERLDAAGAQASFERALQRAPEHGRAWIGLGSLTMLSQDFAKSAEQLERGLRAMPTHVGSWQVLGWNKLLSGDLDAAEKIFQHALGINRNFCESHGGLASVAALRGNRAEAERLAEVAERLDPNCNSSKFARAVLAGRIGAPEKFRAELASAIARMPGPGPVSTLAKKLSPAK